MEGSNSNARGYSTHIVGAIKPAIETLHIVLYNSNNVESEYRRINLLNMQEIHDWLIDKGDEVLLYDSLKRSSSTANFEYSWTDFKYSDNRYSRGFNTILYMSGNGVSVLGYTNFAETQGEYTDLLISLSFQANLNEMEDRISIYFSLADLKGKKNQTPQDLLKLSDFTTPSNIGEDEFGSRNYYSRDPRVTIVGDYKSSLYSPGNNLSVGETKVGKAPIGRNININPYMYNGFETYNIGYFNGNLVIYLIDNDNLRYSVSNIGTSSLNAFNVPGECISLPSTGYVNLPSHSPSISKIIYGAGPYLICEDRNGDTRIYNFRDKLWINEDFSYGVFVDPFDVTAKIRKRPQNNLGLSDLLLYYPEIANTHDFSTIFNENYIYRVLRKIGSWLIMEKSVYVLGQKTSTYFVTSPQMTLWITEDEIDELKFINDSSVLLRNKIGTYDYYTLYTCPGSSYFSSTYQVDDSSEGSGLGTDKFVNTYPLGLCTPTNDMGTGIRFFAIRYYSLDVISSNKLTKQEYENWMSLECCLPGPSFDRGRITDIDTMRSRANLYDEGKVLRFIDPRKPVNKTSLNSYRKGALPQDQNGYNLDHIPEIIDSYGGYIFYLSNNKLNYL